MFSRKAQRKQQRADKKKKKDLFYRKAKGQPVPVKEMVKPKPKPKFQRNDDDDGDISQSDDSIQFDNKPRKKSHFELERERRLIREEERDIKAYEKLLKLKSYRKRNRLPKSFYLDGLGELIELCDNKKYENRIATDDDEDAPKNLQESDNESDMASGSDFSDENENDESEEMNEDSEVDDELEFDDQTKSNTRRNASRVIDNEGRYEDIYGIVRNKDGEILEAEATKEKKLTIDLDVVVDENVQRKLRGLLNRLTAENIKPISSQIVELYRTYSRYMINKGIFCCIENLVINAQHNVSCKIVSEISLLIAYLHVEIGEEVGGYFIHSIICQFDSAFKDTTQSDVKLNNIIIMILNMYATGLLDSRVVYDIIEMFCKRFDEKSIEIIDLILKSSGFMLRKDDAAKMKSLIIDIQKLSSNVDLSGTGNRIKFILESLNAIKNNNMTKLKSSTTVVMTELIEETLKSLLKKSKVPTIPGQYSEVIQSSSWFSFTKNIISLEPINQKDKASDSEYIFDDRHVDFEMRDRICRALRINTPLRKDLFTAIFQCNDYIDAACKLISIGKKQFSEVINLIIHVALNEKNYNPFYYHLLQHLSTCDRKYKLALDFSIRDKIIQVETLKVNNVANLEKLISNLLTGNAISITCLKVVQFSDMNEVYVNFIRNILQSILSQDETTIGTILGKIPNKDSFASAIKLFITCFMDNEMKSKVSSIKQLQIKLKV